MVGIPLPDVGVRKPPKKIAQKQLELRRRLWPDVPSQWLWDRKQRNGFTTIPRTLPIIMSMMNDLTKDQHLSETYLELWCRSFDGAFVNLSNSKEIAHHSGFTGQRAERTWRERMNSLQRLGFVMLHEGPSGPLSYALILNPYLVIQKLVASGTPGLTKDKVTALLARAIEIGADDLDDSASSAQEASPEVPTSSGNGVSN